MTITTGRCLFTNKIKQPKKSVNKKFKSNSDEVKSIHTVYSIDKQFLQITWSFK